MAKRNEIPAGRTVIANAGLNKTDANNNPIARALEIYKRNGGNGGFARTTARRYNQLLNNAGTLADSRLNY